MATVKVSEGKHCIRAHQMAKGDYAIVADPDCPEYQGLVVVATTSATVSLDGMYWWVGKCTLLVKPIGAGRIITITV